MVQKMSLHEGEEMSLNESTFDKKNSKHLRHYQANNYGLVQSEIKNNVLPIQQSQKISINER